MINLLKTALGSISMFFCFVGLYLSGLPPFISFPLMAVITLFFYAPIFGLEDE